MRITILLYAILLTGHYAYAQDSLVLKNNRRILFSRLSMQGDELEVKNEETKEFEVYPCEMVHGYSEGLKERTYFLKQDPESEDKSFVFFNRLEVGRVSLFENVGNDRGLYAEKDGKFERVFGLTDSRSQKSERLELFQSFVQDDGESMSYINSSSFKQRWKDFITVVQYYNRRNFIQREPSAEDVMGVVYLYRTKFQKTKDAIKIRLNGRNHDLYIEDYIILNLPVDYASKLTLRDAYVKNEIVISGELIEQYFEVLYDSKSNTFRFDKKVGTELRYEFYKIKDKVGDRVTHD